MVLLSRLHLVLLLMMFGCCGWQMERRARLKKMLAEMDDDEKAERLGECTVKHPLLPAR